MGRSIPVSVIARLPQTEQGRKRLAQQVSCVQAEYAASVIGGLNGAAAQKLELLSAVIGSLRQHRQAAGGLQEQKTRSERM